MKSGWAVPIMFLLSLLGMALSLWVNIRFVKTKVGRWDSSCTVWFAMSIGQFGKKAKEIWQERAGFSEEEMGTIIQHQLLSLLGGFLSFLASAALIALLVAK